MNRNGIKWGCLLILLQFLAGVPLVQAEALRMATVEQKPFVMKQNGELTGFTVDLFDEIALQMGREARYILAPGVPEMMEAVKNKDVDGAIAGIAITSQLEKEMDFTQPVYDAGLRIMVPELKGPYSLVSVGRAIWKSGLLQLLGIALLVLMVGAHVIWLLERGGKGKIRDRYVGGIWDAFWWSLVVLTRGGSENQAPVQAAARVYAVLWVVAGLFVSSIIIAKLTAAFTVQELRGDIHSWRDLPGKKVGVVKGSKAAAFLAQQEIPATAYKNSQTLFRDVKTGRLEAAVHDRAKAEYFANQEGRQRVQIVGRPFKSVDYGIALPTKSPLLEEFNRILLKLRENGTYARLHQQWFGN